jgi:hypothetical protein
VAALLLPPLLLPPLLLLHSSMQPTADLPPSGAR